MVLTAFRAVCLAASLLCIGMGASCTTAPRTSDERADLQAQAAAAVARARQVDPSLGAVLDNAHSYAVFPTVGKAAFVAGGAYGKGVVYEHGVMTGYCDLTQASIGLALGGQAYTEFIVFRTPEALQRFKSNTLAFDAQATAVAVRAGAGANARYENDVAVFTLNEAGLMGEASVGGQKFTYQPR
ncbi:MAG TPA: YSC84-related protein [Phycisphaerales bacterium]|nr:YSC84-related protein [Phycisphaerales bacterium]